MPIPLEVSDEETLVRCLCSPFHCKDGKLLWRAFQPPRNSDEVSVIRGNHVSPHLCKEKGKALADHASVPPKTYAGLAVIAAGAVRRCGADVVDSRDVFEGHADIRHGHQAADHEPPLPTIVEAVRERCKKLLKYADFMIDPNCDEEPWNGPALIASDRWTTDD